MKNDKTVYIASFSDLITFTNTVLPDEVYDYNITFNSLARSIVLREISISAQGMDASTGRAVNPIGYFTGSSLATTHNIDLSLTSSGNYSSTLARIDDGIALLSKPSCAYWEGYQPLNGNTLTMHIQYFANSINWQLNDELHIYCKIGYNELL